MINQLETNNRNMTFDIAKGIGIILVVLAHCHCPYRQFWLTWFMPFFFIISGYFFNLKYIKSFDGIKTKFKKLLKSLYLPFISANIIFLLFHNFFIKINFYTTNPIIINYANDPFVEQKYYSFKQIFEKIFCTFIMAREELICNPAWFLTALLIISCSYLFAGGGNLQGCKIFRKINSYI